MVTLSGYFFVSTLEMQGVGEEKYKMAEALSAG
jgi:hypothetical protein